ncbi:MAG: hypothetical protein ACYTF8_01445 [Planctomycetota bacterium]|jgi:tetratricopeptide (TPR) repeat protein
MRALCVLVLFGVTFENGKLTDPLWNLTYEAPGLSRILAPGDPALLIRGRCQGDVLVDLTVREGPEKIDGAAWRKARRAAWTKAGRKLEQISEGDEPHPWLLCIEEKYGVFKRHHGYAFVVRGYHCFEVHAWVAERTAASEAQLRKALVGLALGEDKGCGLAVREAAMAQGRKDLDPRTLLAAGIEYARGRRAHLALATAVLRRAKDVAQPRELEQEERWRLYRVGGDALLRSGAVLDAIDWLQQAEKAAPEPEEARRDAYDLARACSLAGKLDEAFAALDRAFVEGLVVSKARLSTEKELGNLRKDPRWETFWRERVAGK